MHRRQAPGHAAARRFHWALLAIGAGAVLALAVVAGRAIITIVTLD